MRRNGNQRFGNAAAHERSHPIGNHAGNAVDGTFHLRIGQVVSRIRFLRTCLFQRGFCYGKRISCRGKVVFRHHLFREQLLLAGVVQTGSLHLRLRRVDVGYRRAEGCPVRHLVDDKHHLAFLHFLTLSDAKFGNLARHLRIDFNVLPSTDGSGITLVNLSRSGGDGYHVIRCRGIISGRLLLASDQRYHTSYEDGFHCCSFHII